MNESEKLSQELGAGCYVPGISKIEKASKAFIRQYGKTPFLGKWGALQTCVDTPNEEWYPTPAEELETALITLTELGYEVDTSSLKTYAYFRVILKALTVIINAVSVDFLSPRHPKWGYFSSLFRTKQTDDYEERWLVGNVVCWTRS